MFTFSQFPFIIKTFRLLARHKPAKLLTTFILALLMGINAGFSIVLLIPLLQLLQPFFRTSPLFSKHGAQIWNNFEH